MRTPSWRRLCSVWPSTRFSRLLPGVGFLDRPPLPYFAEVEDLDEMATRLLAIARKLPPGKVRHEVLKQIGQFRVRIDALREKYVLAASRS